MANINRRRIAGNEIWWLAEGRGAHGATPGDPEEVENSLHGAFRVRRRER